MLSAIAWELENQKSYLQGARIETLYLGGGTPSLLSVEELQRIFGVIEKHYDIGGLKECTLETNPDDLNSTYIKELKQTPVNRFSIGVQSFFDSDLHYMNRAHNARQADYAIKAAQDAGFENLTIDLIYGTPGLSNNAWLENLAKTESLVIPHFSAYALTVEEGTALHHAIQHKKQTPVDQEQAAAQLELLMSYAPRMGFEQYEISNFAARQQYAVHNTNYWKGVPYLGIGPSAHSFDGQDRRSNVANNSRYIRSIVHERKLDAEVEQLTENQRLNEYVMTSLRTKWGCDLLRVERSWGAAGQLKRAAQPFLEQGWLKLENNVLLLTDAGKLFADHIAAELFVI